MESNLLKYIWKHSRRQQLTVVAMTLLSFPILYFTLELPKWIINDALSKTSGTKVLFGLEFTPVQFLAALCMLLLTLIILNGVLKMRINTYKGIIGERLVRRLRYTLIQNTLRFPLPYFSRISSGELISTVTAETEPLGGYIGESIALPLFQGGTMITILVFMFAQDWIFGLVSVALIPVQGYVIPKLQHQVNMLKKDRVKQVRKLSERIGETVAGATEIRIHGTQPYTLSDFSRRLGDLFQVRLEIFKKKFFMKFLNNTIGQITPFMFYLFGGYLVIKGDLTIGALVAAIGAYKDLTSPWRELLNFYQLFEDSKIKYQQIIELFNPDKLVEIDEIETESKPKHLNGEIFIQNVSWRKENGEQVLADINLRIAKGTMIAITGDDPIPRSRLAQIITGLDQPSSGTVFIDGKPIEEIPDSILRRRLSLQGPDPHMFAGTVIQNLEYGLMQHEPECASDAISKSVVDEALAAGNRPPIVRGWLDYRQAGEEQKERSANWYLRVIHAIGASDIVAERSLLEFFDPEEKPELAKHILVARSEIRKRLQERNQSAHIAQFDPDIFNSNTSIAENILFGIAIDHRLDCRSFDIHPYFFTILEQQNLMTTALNTGLTIGRKLLAMVDKDTISDQLLSRFGLDEESTIERTRLAVENCKMDAKLSEPDRHLLTSLFLLMIPERDRFVELDNRSATRLVQARREFKHQLPTDLQDAVIYFDISQYHPKLNIKDNLLFGRMSSSNPAEQRAIKQLLEQVIHKLDLQKDLALLFGESQVGINGSRLPLVARHRVGLGRALMKKPDILIFHDALAPYVAAEQVKRRKEIRKLLPGTTIVWISREIPNPLEFDQVYKLTESGQLIAAGINSPAQESLPSNGNTNHNSSPVELIANSLLFSELAPDQQQHIAESSKLVFIPGDSCIYEINDEPDSAWLVVNGEIITKRAEDSGIQLSGTFRRSEVFGLLDVLADCPRIMSAHSTQDTLLLRINAEAIESIALSDVQVSRKLLRSLSNQWRQ